MMNESSDPIKQFFSVVVRGQTYLNLFYLLLAFPLGLIYFILLVTGFSLGFGLLIVWVGLLILAMMLGVWWALIAFERQMAVGLLHVRMGPMEKVTQPQASLWQQIKSFLSNPVTWKGLVFLIAKFPLGIISFVALVTAFAATGALIVAPFFYPYINIDLGFMQVNTLGGAIVAAVVGIFFGFISLHILNGLAYLSGEFARVMLGTTVAVQPGTPASSTPAENLQAAGPAGAPEVVETPHDPDSTTLEGS
jgi:hypothetical protein